MIQLKDSVCGLSASSPEKAAELLGVNEKEESEPSSVPTQ